MRLAYEVDLTESEYIKRLKLKLATEPPPIRHVKKPEPKRSFFQIHVKFVDDACRDV